MSKKPDGDDKNQKPRQKMNESEMIYRIIHIFTRPEISESKRLEMLEAIEKIAASPDTPETGDPGEA
jgi:hypothetical protein